VVVGASTGCSQQEVRVVEHVERLPLELQVHTLREIERLPNRHVSSDLTRTLELVAPHAYASQARCRDDWQIPLTRCSRTSVDNPTGVRTGWTPAVFPSAAGWAELGDAAAGAIILSAIEIVVATDVCALPISDVAYGARVIVV